MWPVLVASTDLIFVTSLPQFRLVMQYLSKMSDTQTLVMYSGHPLGLFPARIGVSPKVVVTNGMVIPGWSTQSVRLSRAFGG